MTKLRLYLDTSVPSFLFADDSPERKEITQKFWDLLGLGVYDVYVSEVLLREINDARQPLRRELISTIAALVPEIVYINPEIVMLADKYVEEQISHFIFKMTHCIFAAATYAGCDALISWNFKHMVRLKTIRGVNAVNQLLHYRQIEILTPQSWVEEDRDE